MIKHLNRGELLSAKEILYLANNIEPSYHARQRIAERFGTMDLSDTIINSLYCYHNTDYSINVVIGEHQCLVCVELPNKKWKAVTVKENTHCSMARKRELAMRGVDRI